jgi:hypothetical protein
VSYVLAVKGSEPLGTATQGSATATGLAAGVPPEQWVACSAGHGAKGRRLDDWTRIQLAAPAAAGCTRWLLVRRSRRDGELAFYACFGPVETSLLGLVGWPGPDGRWRRASSRPRPRSAWTTTRCPAGRAGTGTSPWPCWPMPSWSSPAPRPPPASRQRGMRRPDQPARPAPAHRARGPPTADCPGVDDTPPAWLRAGLVTLAAPSPGPRPTGTLPTTRTTSAAGVLRG